MLTQSSSRFIPRVHIGNMHNTNFIFFWFLIIMSPITKSIMPQGALALVRIEKLTKNRTLYLRVFNKLLFSIRHLSIAHFSRVIVVPENILNFHPKYIQYFLLPFWAPSLVFYSSILGKGRRIAGHITGERPKMEEQKY